MPQREEEIKMPSLGAGVAAPGPAAQAGGVPSGVSSSRAGRPAADGFMPGKPSPKKNRRKYLLLLFLLAAFVTAGVVPVGKIPLLRNVAWMMGFSEEDTAHMSFLKALFTWADNGFVFRSVPPAENAYSFFDRNGGQSGRLINGQAASGLFNMREVDAAGLRQGRGAERVTGAAGAETWGKDSSVKVSVSKDASAATDANSSAKGNVVFFGEDPTLVQADKNQGFDTAASGVKKNARITGSAGGTDWFNQAVKKASLVDVQNMDPNVLGTGTSSLTTLAGLDNIGNSKDVRDLNFAWLLGKAARRSSKPLVRKTLATISWTGGEVPKKVFEVSGSSGIGIDPDTVIGDISDIKTKMKEEAECDEKSSSEGKNISAIMQAAMEDIEALKGSFPFDTCDSGKLAAWETSVREVERKCRTASASYDSINQACKINQRGTQGNCSAVRLQDMVNEQRGKCGEMLPEAERLAQEAAAEAGTMPAPVDEKDLDPSKGIGDVPGTGYNSQTAEENVNRQFNVPLDGKDNADGDGFFTKPGSIAGGGSSSQSGSASGDVSEMLDGLLDRWKK